MQILDIRKESNFEEIDYLRLKSILRGYSQPRNKIRTLLKANDLIRIKKGIYIFGKRANFNPINKEHLANMIYGPSAISLEYALSLYDMIPEKVEEITSITLRKNKLFKTPVGRFSYHYLGPKKYSIGITLLLRENLNILIATPEKALCDVISLHHPNMDSRDAFQELLYQNLRLEESMVKKLNLELITKLYQHYQNKNIKWLLLYLKEIKK